MIKRKSVYCDHCGSRMVALPHEDCLEDMDCSGWSEYRTAAVHFCSHCKYEIFENWQPPCCKCHSHRCERGIECWAYPPSLEMLPYETYFAPRYKRQPFQWFRKLAPGLRSRDRHKVETGEDIPF